MSLPGPPPRVTTLLDAAEQVGLFPAAALEIFEVLRDAEIDGKRLASVIGRDPVLTGRILKTANSPFYGRQRKVGTIEQALVVLGFHVVRDLAVSFALVAMGRTASPAAAPLWRHSQQVGVLAATLAKVVRTVDPAAAMVVGMLHDLGEVVMLEVEPARHTQLLARMKHDDPRIVMAERVLFGIDHADLGAACVLHWGLPTPYAALIRDHHSALVDPVPPLASVLHLADAGVGLLERGVPASAVAEDLAECPANAGPTLPASTLKRCLDSLAAGCRDLLR